MNLAVKILVIFLVSAQYGSRAANETKPVYFSLIISGGENGSFRSSGGVPSIDIALEAVQSRELLPGYSLTYNRVRNSKCTRTDSLDAFFQDTQDSAVTKIAVIGCGCSTATEPVAEISHYWNITQISFAAASSDLSDRRRFKHYFRTTPSFGTYAPSILGVLNKYKWKQLAFISENHGTFLKIIIDFEELLKHLRDGTSEFCCFDNDNVIVENAVFQNSKDSASVAGQLFDESKLHVFLVNGFSSSARKIICEASKRDLVYPHFGWIMFGWYADGWWTEEVTQEQIDCTDEELESFLGKARPLLIQLLPEPDDYDLPTDAGFSSDQFIKRYHKRLPQSGYKLSTVFVIAFDAMWTVAKALNRTEEMRLKNVSRNDSTLEECRDLPGELVPLNEFTYSNAFMGCVIKCNYQNTNFTGVSGPIRYDKSGTIVYTRVRWAQRRHINGELKTVRFGYLNTESNFTMVYEENEGDDVVYPDGFPPDGIPLAITVPFHSALIIAYYLLAIIGAILCALLFIFNFMYRNTKVVRLTTPSLNYVIISGALLMYFSVFIGLLPRIEEAVIRMQCIVHVWFYGIGYLLVYGTILSKMWRVYQIFHNPNPNKTILKNWHLMCIVIGICGAGMLLILARSIAQGITDPQLVTNTEDPQGTTSSAIREDYSVWQCYELGSAPFVFDVLIFVYLNLLQLVGIILAFQTRKVKIPILNDSKSVTALIYISSIVLVVIVLITFILRGYLNVSAAMFYGGIILLATIFLIFIFVPKVIHLYRDPSGKEIFSGLDPIKSTEQTQIREQQNSMVAGMTELNDSEKVILMGSHIAKLTETLDVKSKRITELEAIIKTSK